MRDYELLMFLRERGLSPVLKLDADGQVVIYTGMRVVDERGTLQKMETDESRHV